MRPRTLVSLARISRVSPGVTALRNFTLSALMKNTTFGASSAAPRRSMMRPAAWAMASTCRTPGMTGWPGKWPWKKGSLIVTFLIATRESSVSSTTRSTITNG